LGIDSLLEIGRNQFVQKKVDFQKKCDRGEQNLKLGDADEKGLSNILYSGFDVICS
jgi:hypothetical protein